MNPTLPEHRALYNLFGSVFDGTISEENRQVLQHHLAHEPGTRKLWFDYCDVDSGMRELRRHAPSLQFPVFEDSSPSAELTSRPKATNVNQMWPGLIWAAAAIVVFGIGLFQAPVRLPSEPVLASFGEMREALWASPEASFRSGDFVRGGQTLELLSGSVDLKFRSGASVTLHAPAIFQATSENEGFLKFGNLSARVSTRGAKGFTVQTPTARIVDVGTEFTASTAADGQSRVAVKSGEVFVHLPWAEQAKRVLGGENLTTENNLQRINVRMESGDGTEAFRLPSIDRPSEFESAHTPKASAVARLLGGEAHMDPVISHGEEGRILVDLGSSISVTKINAYSWGKGGVFDNDRGAVAQNFELYGSNAANSAESRETLSQNGWELIGRVDSDHYFGKGASNGRADQQASSFTSSSGCLGRYRYLLCVPIRRSSDLAVAQVKSCMSLFDVYSEPWTF